MKRTDPKYIASLPPGARRDWSGVAGSAAAARPELSPEQERALRGVIWEDVLSEYDARFYSAYVRTLDIDFSDAFWAMERRWAIDEERHFRVARDTYERLFGVSESRETELRARAADFEPLAHLFGDEFLIACLGAYDELATVFAYRANLPYYDALGPEYSRFIRGVIADEAWHYGGFLDLIANRHAHRVGEAEAAIEQITRAEGTPYGNTFVLDHDDQVFDPVLLDRTAKTLRRQISRLTLRRESPRPRNLDSPRSPRPAAWA